MVLVRRYGRNVVRIRGNRGSLIVIGRRVRQSRMGRERVSLLVVSEIPGLQSFSDGIRVRLGRQLVCRGGVRRNDSGIDVRHGFHGPNAGRAEIVVFHRGRRLTNPGRALSGKVDVLHPCEIVRGNLQDAGSARPELAHKVVEGKSGTVVEDKERPIRGPEGRGPCLGAEIERIHHVLVRLIGSPLFRHECIEVRRGC